MFSYKNIRIEDLNEELIFRIFTACIGGVGTDELMKNEVENFIYTIGGALSEKDLIEMEGYN